MPVDFPAIDKLSGINVGYSKTNKVRSILLQFTCSEEAMLYINIGALFKCNVSWLTILRYTSIKGFDIW